MKKLETKTRTQLAQEYNMSRKGFVNRLKKAGIHLERGVIMPNDLERIYNRFGEPKEENEK